jgi:hypothetical protein
MSESQKHEQTWETPSLEDIPVISRGHVGGGGLGQGRGDILARDHGGVLLHGLSALAVASLGTR